MRNPRKSLTTLGISRIPRHQIYRKYLNPNYLEEYFDQWIPVHEHIYNLLIDELARKDVKLLALFIPAANRFASGQLLLEERGGLP